MRSKALHVKQQGYGFMMPEYMALAKAFCVALEDEHVGTSQASINFEAGSGGCF
jgi:hypothetical protein